MRTTIKILDVTREAMRQYGYSDAEINERIKHSLFCSPVGGEEFELKPGVVYETAFKEMVARTLWLYRAMDKNPQLIKEIEEIVKSTDRSNN